MAITQRNLFLKTLKDARRKTILLQELKSSILDNVEVDLETVPFQGSNSTNLDEAIQCYIDYGELPLSGNLEDFWKVYQKVLNENKFKGKSL